DIIRLVPLSSLSRRDAARWANDLFDAMDVPGPALRDRLFDILEWLWETVCGPVLESIADLLLPTGNELPRLWWCPTGPLTALPPHGGGLYRRGPGEGAISVGERVVSSYTTTLSAMMRARRPPAPSRPSTLLAVGLPETDGRRPLPAVRRELDR